MMELMSLSDFMRRKRTTVEMAEAYDMFLDWDLRLGMFIPCKDDVEILTEGFSRKAEWERGLQLLVFNGFQLDDHGEDYVCVTNGSCYLVFEYNGEGYRIVDESDNENLREVNKVKNLIVYPLELTHPW